MDDSLIRLPDIEFPEGFPKGTPLCIHEEEGHGVRLLIAFLIHISKHGIYNLMSIFTVVWNRLESASKY